MDNRTVSIQRKTDKVKAIKDLILGVKSGQEGSIVFKFLNKKAAIDFGGIILIMKEDEDYVRI